MLYLDATRSLYGASRMLLTLLQNLQHSPHSSHSQPAVTPLVVLSNDAQDDLRLLHALVDLHVRCWEYPLAVLRRQKYLNLRGLVYLTGTFLRSVRLLRRIIQAHRVDIVQTNTSTVLSGAVAARLAGIPHIWHVHELFRRWEGWVLMRLISALSSCVVAPSAAVAQNMVKAYPPVRRKLKIIPNGVDPQVYSSVPAEAVDRLRAEWQLPANAPVAGMVGRIGMWKGETQFVEAAEQVSRQVADARFIIVGGVFDEGTHHLAALQKLISDKGLESRVLVVGLRDDVPVIMNLLDVLVHLPTRPEPFGLVAIEAMAASRPVVAVALGGLTEIVVHGETGFLTPPADVTAAARYIVELLEQPELRRRLGANGRRRVESEFSAAVYARRFEALYNRVRSHAKPRRTGSRYGR